MKVSKLKKQGRVMRYVNKARDFFSGYIPGAAFGYATGTGMFSGGSAGYKNARKSRVKAYKQWRKNLKPVKVYTSKGDVYGSYGKKQVTGSNPNYVTGSKPMPRKKMVTFGLTKRAKLRRKVQYKPKSLTWRFQ